jgi:hypothetical protein
MSNPFEGTRITTIKRRGDPKWAILETGERVEKQERLYFVAPAQMMSVQAGQWVSVRAADYHGEHFIYLDPLYNDDKKHTGRGHWFAACTCGSPAVLVGPSEARLEDPGTNEQLLVCWAYHASLHDTGFGRHMTTGEKPWR